MRLQSVLVVGDHDSTPDGDGGGEDGLLDGGVKVHYSLWQVTFFYLFQLHQDYPLLLFGDRALGQRPLESMSTDILIGQ